MKILKFHLYLVDLNPRMGTEPGKIRPVVVVQTDMLNDTHPSTIICPISSNVIKDSTILRVHLTKKESSLDAASDILVDQIRAVDNRRFIKHIGKISAACQAQLSENLKLLILE